MFGGPWKLIGIALAVLAVVSAVGLHFRNDARTRDKLATLRDEAEDVVLATQAASGNDKVTWELVPGQVVALGESNRRLKDSIKAQNLAIDELARREVALKARAKELKIIADKAEAQRRSALKWLSDMTLEPGAKNDCMLLLAEAERALDIVKEAGL